MGEKIYEKRGELVDYPCGLILEGKFKQKMHLLAFSI